MEREERERKKRNRKRGNLWLVGAAVVVLVGVVSWFWVSKNYNFTH